MIAYIKRIYCKQADLGYLVQYRREGYEGEDGGGAEGVEREGV